MWVGLDVKPHARHYHSIYIGKNNEHYIYIENFTELVTLAFSFTFQNGLGEERERER
jgi:hypothetical protein